jgi:hypothetical protein
LDFSSGTTAHSALGAQWDGDWIQNNPKRGFSPLGYATLRRDWLRSLSGGTEGMSAIFMLFLFLAAVIFSVLSRFSSQASCHTLTSAQ